MLYQGSCHCGQITFAVDGEITDVITCNCSICQRKGSILWFVPRDKLTLYTAPDHLATYRFNTQTIAHHFCPACGIHPFGEGVGPDGQTMAAVNVRCLEGISLDTLSIGHFDGRSA